MQLTHNFIVIKDAKTKIIQREINKHKVYITGNDLPAHINIESALRSFFTAQPICVINSFF